MPASSKLPKDLSKALETSPKTRAAWDALTPIGRRDFISWIDQAQKPETRKRRIESIPSRIASGKRGPCCYARIPMNLYKELKTSPKAQTAWKGLSPDEKRNFADWIGEELDTDKRAQRITKACELLASGKRKPK